MNKSNQSNITNFTEESLTIERTSLLHDKLVKSHLEKNNEINKNSPNFYFVDSSQKSMEVVEFESAEQLWWWKNAVIARNVWYYRDRLSTPRGPCTLPVLRESWAKGFIDDKTLIWGNGCIDWIPIRNIALLSSAIRTPEVQLATWLKKKLVLTGKLVQVRKE